MPLPAQLTPEGSLLFTSDLGSSIWLQEAARGAVVDPYSKSVGSRKGKEPQLCDLDRQPFGDSFTPSPAKNWGRWGGEGRTGKREGNV